MAMMKKKKNKMICGSIFAGIHTSFILILLSWGGTSQCMAVETDVPGFTSTVIHDILQKFQQLDRELNTPGQPIQVFVPPTYQESWKTKLSTDFQSVATVSTLTTDAYCVELCNGCPSNLYVLWQNCGDCAKLTYNLVKSPLILASPTELFRLANTGGKCFKHISELQANQNSNYYPQNLAPTRNGSPVGTIAHALFTMQLLQQIPNLLMFL